jgi:transcriptional regulator
MLVRPCWRPESLDEILGLIEEHPWALLVSNGADGPLATNLPLLLRRSEGSHGILVGHLARANAHAAALLEATAPSLAVFGGPYSYITPTWYPERDMPGTYYYTAVHCYGHARALDAARLEAELGSLNDRMEAGRPDGWRLDEIPHAEITRRLPAIVGFELEIERLEAKLKLGQDEPLKDVLAVAERLEASDSPMQRQLAEAVRRANVHRRDDGSG